MECRFCELRGTTVKGSITWGPDGSTIAVVDAMKCAFVFLAAAISLAAQPTDIAGDWQGTLQVAADQIHLTLHITSAEHDTLTATIDSAEQGARGVKVTSIDFKDSRLPFAIDSIHGTYDGALNASTGAVDGIWSQGQPTPVTFVRIVKSRGNGTRPSELNGLWQGIMQVGGYAMHIVFHITTNSQGLAATMDSPDQGATGVEVVNVRRDGDTLTMQLPNIGAKYQGTIAKDLSVIDGGFTQGGASLPLSLKRNSDPK